MKLECPNCGSNVVYKIGTDKVYCSHCKQDTSISSLNELLNKKKSKICFEKEYTCSSCGANIFTIDDSVIKYCNFCGSSNFKVDNYNQEARKLEIIPFKYTKEQFLNEFKRHIAGNKASNKKYFSESAITKIAGLYVPVSIVDYDMNYKSKGSFEFDADNSLNLKKFKKYAYSYETNYDATISFDSIRKLPDYIINNLMPFDRKDLQPFSPFYMAGMSTPKTDDFEYDKVRATSSSVLSLLKTVVNNSCGRPEKFDSIYNELKLKKTNKKEYYFPVWICSYEYNSHIYSFAMNGQTGKIVSTLPKDITSFNKMYKNGKKYVVFACLPYFGIILYYLFQLLYELDNDKFSFIVLCSLLVIFLVVVIICLLIDKKRSKEYFETLLSNVDYDKNHNYELRKKGKDKKEFSDYKENEIERKDTITIE